MMIFGPQTSETAQLLSILLQVLLCRTTFSTAEKWQIDATLLSLTKGHSKKTYQLPPWTEREPLCKRACLL